jgi:hypothetical protein
MPRPNLDRVMVSFYVARTTKATVDKLAARRGEPKAETYRALLTYALREMPKGWKP